MLISWLHNEVIFEHTSRIQFQESSVYKIVTTGDEGGLIGTKIQGKRGYLLWLSHPADRLRRFSDREKLIAIRKLAETRRDLFGVDVNTPVFQAAFADACEDVVCEEE